MSLDVALTPVGLTAGEVHGRLVFVIDILRANTTICAALAAGARAVIPASTADEAKRLAQTLGPQEALLAGERQCVRIAGFALGNSPLEVTPDQVRGRTVVLTTSNGTGALLAAEGARQVVVAAAVNFALVAARIREAWMGGDDILIVCAGREHRFALDDGYTAGRLVEAALAGERGRKGLSDAALAMLDLVRRYGRRWALPLTRSASGRDLLKLGMRADIEVAATPDVYPVLPLLVDRRVVAAPVTGPTQASSTT
jgi:2-phosphosulfolactate phosphatase